MRVMWNSTYSELTEDEGNPAIEDFKIHFKDPCMDNQLTLSSGVSSFVYQVGSGTVTKTPSISESVSTSTCVPVAKCEIFTESTQTWDDCNSGYYAHFYNSFSTSSG